VDPNDFANTAAVARALNEFEHHYNKIAQPFDWNFTRQDLTSYSIASTNANETARSHSPPDQGRDPGGLRSAARS
jgi:hypothetical protein